MFFARNNLKIYIKVNNICEMHVWIDNFCGHKFKVDTENEIFFQSIVNCFYLYTTSFPNIDNIELGIEVYTNGLSKKEKLLCKAIERNNMYEDLKTAYKKESIKTSLIELYNMLIKQE